jgi:transcriptional regulator GlxA family with amidase domain
MNRREAMVATLAGVAAMTVSSQAADVAEPVGTPLKPSKDGNVYVAYVIGPHQNVIDLAGAWETFQDVAIPTGKPNDYNIPFQLATVSDKNEPLEATGGLLIKPNHTFESYPVQPNIIVMGAQGEHSEKKIAWIREASKNADLVMSVCTGAFLLAKTGLLDGLRATTHHDFYDKFEKQFPKVRLVRGPRYVDNGKFACAGGLTSGIELALTVVQRYFGPQVAAQNAYYMEYTRSPQRPVTAAVR